MPYDKKNDCFILIERPSYAEPEEILVNLNRVAMKITEDLFTDGTNRKASRLVIEFEDKKLSETGWSKSAVQCVIEKHLKRVSKKQY